jgi:hypothetical protein
MVKCRCYAPRHYSATFMAGVRLTRDQDTAKNVSDFEHSEAGGLERSRRAPPTRNPTRRPLPEGTRGWNVQRIFVGRLRRQMTTILFFTLVGNTGCKVAKSHVVLSHSLLHITAR